jgi:hypothetical protein
MRNGDAYTVRDLARRAGWSHENLLADSSRTWDPHLTRIGVKLTRLGKEMLMLSLANAEAAS